MHNIWEIGAYLLELLCVVFMVGVFVVGYNQVNLSNDLTQKNMYASDAQAEYATYSVYDSEVSGEIAYTEVLDCIYRHASERFPVIIARKPDITVGNFTNVITTGREVFYGPSTSGGSPPTTWTYKELSDYLRVPEPGVSPLKYYGEVMWRDNGSVYGIRFSY